MRRGDMESVHVVQHTVPGLACNGEAPWWCVGYVVQRPADHGVVHDTNGVGVCQTDRRGEQTRLPNPLQPRELAVAVQSMGASKERVSHLGERAGKNGGDAGANRSNTALECAVTLDDGGGSNAHARNIGDSVRWARSKPADADSKVGGSGVSWHGGSVPSRTTLSLCCRRSSPSPALRVSACRFDILAQRSCLLPRSSSLRARSSRGGSISRSDPGPQTELWSSLRSRQPAQAAPPLQRPTHQTLQSARAPRRHPSRPWIQACSFPRSPVTLFASW